MKRGDVCYGMLRAAACVDESDHHALMYVRHGQTVREHGVDERSVGRPGRASWGSYDAAAVILRLTLNAAAFAAARPTLLFKPL